MIEYKIICDRKQETVKTGMIEYKQGVAPIKITGGLETRIYKNKKDANAALKRTIESCAQYDQKTRDNIARYPDRVYDYIVTQKNIHIVSRTVTDWK